jgi:hypothetical protein
MGFDLNDIGNEKRIIFVNFWNWRPTVEVLRRAGLLDAKRLDGLYEQFSGTRVTKDEARAIAHHLREKVLPNLPHTARILLDGSITTAPDDGTFHKSPEDSHKNYGAIRSWLEEFASFCETCDGFELN